MVEIGVKMRKVVIFTVKGCYRLICNHQFLVGLLCFLMLLYTSFPFMFSILVSASPVLVCTAVLLGTLLSFGKPNLPEIEKEERTTHEIVSLKTGFPGDAVVIEKNESCSVERYSDKGRDVVEKSTEETSLVADGFSKVGSDGSFAGTGQQVEARSREIQFDDWVKEEVQRELQGFEYEQKNGMFKARLGDMKTAENQYSLIPEVDDESLEPENDRSPVGSVDSKVVNVDSLDSPPGSPWKHLDEREEEEDEDDEALDSGSDRAESSSLDTSMADILPMLDELHPLLDEDAPQRANLSHDGSDAASERSARSNESTNDSDDETENQEKSEVADDDNEDGEDEEEPHADKEDRTKSAITWTEEDQRNLMELGSSELERNQRLENLIARRRARKTMSMMTEKNLIDLESADLPFNVPPITTTRTNPFDLQHDSYENLGLPPIPGSAPSILLARRNPFDLPYDSSEEKPDLMEDSFREEFVPFQSKESFFRRHESFNVRPSPFGINRPEKRDTRLRPYFVPEHMGSEGTSYLPFQRQSSDLSDSKVSSVPDTESIGSAGDLEERNVTEEDTSVAEVRNHTEEDMSREPELISMIEHVPEIIGHGSVIKEDTFVAEVRNHTVEDMSREPELISMIAYVPEITGHGNVTEEDTSVAEVRNHAEEDMSREPELISMIEDVPENIGHGSESSEDEGTLEFGQTEKRHVEVDETEVKLGDVENHHELEPHLVAEQSLCDSSQVNMNEIHSNTEAVEQRYGGVSTSGVSTSSSLSEESERIYAEREAEEFPTFVEGRDHIEEPSISAQPSVQGLHLNITTALTDPSIPAQPSMQGLHLNIPTALTDDTPHMAPVYDASPTVLTKNLSSSSISSDLHVESEIGLPPVVIKRTISFSGRESEGRSQDMESHSLVDKEMLAGSSETHPVDKTEMGSRGVVEITDHDVIPVNRELLAGSSLSHSVDEIEMRSRGNLAINEHDIVKYDASAVDEISDGTAASVVLETVLDHTSIDAKSSTDTLQKENLLYGDDMSQHARSFDPDTHVAVSDTMHSVYTPSDEQNLAGLEEEKHSANVDQFSSFQLDTLLLGSQSAAHITKRESLLSEQGIVQSNSDSVHHEADEMLTSSHHQHPLTEMSVSLSAEELALSDNSVYQPPGKDQKESLLQEPSITMVESVQELSTTGNLSLVHHEVSPDINIPTSPKSITILSEVYETQAPAVEEANEILEIDEELLSELDTVGDFRVKELGERDDDMELGGQISSLQNDAESFTGLVEVSTQAHEAGCVVHTEHRGAVIKETNEYDEDMKFVSELESSGTNAVEQIDTRQYDQREVYTIDLKSTETSKEKEADVAENILKHNSDAEGPNSTMPEIEAQSVKGIESIFHKAVSTSVETEAVLRNPEASCVEPSLENTAARCSEDGKVDNFSSESKVKMETTNSEEEWVKDFDLDLNQVPEDNIQQIPVSDSVLNAGRSKDKEVTSQGLHVLERVSPDDSNLTLKQASESFPKNDPFPQNNSNLALKEASKSSLKDVLKFSEDGSAQDVANEVGFSKEELSDVKAFDIQKTTQHAPEEPDYEAKTPEGRDVAALDANSKIESATNTSSN